MKKFAKVICFSLVAATMTASMAACGGGKTSDSNPGGMLGDDATLTLTENKNATETVVFEYLDAGFGDDPYIAVANGYMAKNPNVQIQLFPNVDLRETMNSALATNTNISDIYSFPYENSIKGWGALNLLEDLSGLLDEQTEDGRTVRESMTGSAADSVRVGDKVYGIPEYTSITGFVYNKSLFEDYGWQIPNTTKELEDLCKKIIADTNGAVNPITWCQDADGYLYFATENWISQSAGLERIQKFYEYGSKENYALNDDAEGSLYSAKKNAIDALKTFFLPSSEYVYDNSSQEHFMNAQRKVLSGECAMMLNGSWFQNEMYADMQQDAYKDSEIGIFAVPELSDAFGAPIRMTGNNDTKRTLSAAYGSYYMIPTAAINKAGAKDFLVYLSSKEACELYTQYANAIRPFDYDYGVDSELYQKVSTFGQSVLKMADEFTLYAPVTPNPIAMYGAGLWLYDSGRLENAVIRDKGLKSADDYLKADETTANTKWDKWVAESQGN